VVDAAPTVLGDDGQAPAVQAILRDVTEQERADLLAAEFTIESHPGAGTRVRLRLPIPG